MSSDMTGMTGHDRAEETIKIGAFFHVEGNLTFHMK